MAESANRKKYTRKTPRIPESEKNLRPEKIWPQRYAVLGDKNAVANSAEKKKRKAGKRMPLKSRHTWRPRNIKSTSLNRAEAASLDAKPAIAGLSRAELIRTLISA